ncbi:hypothetical protein VOLCADRAFT_89961 [Volvox carteri f. nagariensis]|uniref:Uncharacterized protein n=1 Tax=Volvox carteri f. nagariensis TaxID=3068 RepID=D8TT43_VOLCA|nr:uncharacterized protein VOLCADRAFT_89961 [Volvox carteri f. nagariensis]EFJ49130.1 hypothetical protein VOLCADRAFT_89961 [Volvox carteri f. nagariensis]|eukprot:XP_002949578.1 hypothetical protein VOLCADRAFT_89961 [Volvox carteri f. nagariensis]
MVIVSYRKRGRILAAAPVRRNAQLRQSAGSPHSAPPAVPPWATTHVAPGSCSPRQPPPLGSSPRGPSRNHPHRVSRPCAVLQPYTSLPGYSRFQFRCSGGGGGCLSCGPGSLRLGGNGGGGGSHSRGPRVVCRAGVLEGFSGVSNLMAPEFATVFSAIIAITSVSINLYGGLLTEKRRAELAREVERERQVMAAQDEERSVVARYRGPLLEATVDLEARLYHIATLTGEWRRGDVVCEEEVVYTLFTLAQALYCLGLPGIPAPLRALYGRYEQGDEREHPGCRSRAMMLRGTPALPDDWSDMSYGGDVLERERPPPPPPSAWPRSVAVAAGPRGGGGGGFTVSYGRGPPGPVAGPPPWSVGEPYGAVPPPTKPVLLPNRTDTAAVARSGGSWPAAGPAAGSELVIGSLDEDDLAAAGLGLPDLDIGKLELELDEQSPAGRDSSGGVGGGSAVATTSTALPLGGSAWDASASSAAAASLYYLDDFFSSWLRPVHTDILALVGGRVWGGQGPFPLNRWTRLLLLQQLLVETIELLDPAHVRVPANRRVVLAPVPYKQAPELEAYRTTPPPSHRPPSPCAAPLP